MSRKKLAESPLTFRAVFEPDGGGWHVTLPAVQGCHTWGRSLSEARANLREALACCADEFADPDAVASSALFEEKIHWPKEVQAARRRLERAKDRIAAEEDAVQAAVREITGTLSLRDAGELLGFSHEGVRKMLRKAG